MEMLLQTVVQRPSPDREDVVEQELFKVGDASEEAVRSSEVLLHALSR